MTTFMAFGVTVGRLLLLALLGGVPANQVTQANLKAFMGKGQVQMEQGYATSFGGSDDQLAGGAMACTGRYMKAGDQVCAHRTLPCGTVVMVQSLRTKKVATCVVADRGPYGASLPNGEIILKLKAGEEGEWRGAIDLSPAVARRIELRGRERVSLLYHRGLPRYGRSAKGLR